MLDRIEMNVIKMARKIVLVAYHMIIKPVLPQRPVGSALLFKPPGYIPLHCSDNRAEIDPLSREKQPMHMIRHNHMRKVAERMFILHAMYR